MRELPGPGTRCRGNQITTGEAGLPVFRSRRVQPQRIDIQEPTYECLGIYYEASYGLAWFHSRAKSTYNIRSQSKLVKDFGLFWPLDARSLWLYKHQPLYHWVFPNVLLRSPLFSFLFSSSCPMSIFSFSSVMYLLIFTLRSLISANTNSRVFPASSHHLRIYFLLLPKF